MENLVQHFQGGYIAGPRAQDHNLTRWNQGLGLHLHVTVGLLVKFEQNLGNGKHEPLERQSDIQVV